MGEKVYSLRGRTVNGIRTGGVGPHPRRGGKGGEKRGDRKGLAGEDEPGAKIRKRLEHEAPKGRLGMRKREMGEADAERAVGEEVDVDRARGVADAGADPAQLVFDGVEAARPVVGGEPGAAEKNGVEVGGILNRFWFGAGRFGAGRARGTGVDGLGLVDGRRGEKTRARKKRDAVARGAEKTEAVAEVGAERHEGEDRTTAHGARSPRSVRKTAEAQV